MNNLTASPIGRAIYDAFRQYNTDDNWSSFNRAINYQRDGWQYQDFDILKAEIKTLAETGSHELSIVLRDTQTAINLYRNREFSSIQLRVAILEAHNVRGYSHVTEDPIYLFKLKGYFEMLSEILVGRYAISPQIMDLQDSMENLRISVDDGDREQARNRVISDLEEFADLLLGSSMPSSVMGQFYWLSAIVQLSVDLKLRSNVADPIHQRLKSVIEEENQKTDYLVEDLQRFLNTVKSR